MFNYTSEVAASKTVSEIQAILAQFGARSVSVDYDGKGEIESLHFIIMLEGSPVRFRLPANVSGMLAAMKLKNVARRYCNEIQARRTAWRVIKAWIQSQLALIEAKQAQPSEAFFPYAGDDQGETAYQAFVQNHRRQLTAGGGAPRELQGRQ